MAGGAQAQIFEALFLGPVLSRRGGKQMEIVSAKPNQADLILLTRLLNAGEITPVIDRSYPLSKTAEALRYFGEGYARAKVVIKIASSDGIEALETLAEHRTSSHTIDPPTPSG